MVEEDVDVNIWYVTSKWGNKFRFVFQIVKLKNFYSY